MSKLVRAIRNPNKVISSVKYQIYKFFGHDDYKHVMVLTRSRTGSNFLLSLLNSHSNINILGELLADLEGGDFKTKIHEIYSKQPSYIKVSGFKMFYCHPFPFNEDLTEEVMNYLAGMKDLHIVHLKRKNILRTLTSRKIALNQNTWTSRDYKKGQTTETKTVKFTQEELEKDFAMTRKMEEDSDFLFKDHQIVTIYYEDLAENPEKEVKKVLSPLNMEFQPLKSDLRKQNPEELSDLISNFHELKDSFSGSEWESFFME